ncbi:CLUMA_CG005451, isoform A [Clunio marinus]|uniref:CLUMA_CG005451, isoform A n=1 Tax=Clunio marinus TaxID=568069 RepID=A0A1J1HWU6_9DIPT|nr:CLUMA_CG005451, isoform A [Clunio marinus]
MTKKVVCCSAFSIFLFCSAVIYLNNKTPKQKSVPISCKVNGVGGKCIKREKCCDLNSRIDVRISQDDVSSCGSDDNLICCLKLSDNESDSSQNSLKKSSAIDVSLNVTSKEKTITMIAQEKNDLDRIEMKELIPLKSPHNITNKLKTYNESNKLPSSKRKKFTNHKKCGIKIQKRIFGGTKAYEGEFPFYAALKYKGKKTPFRIMCGGSLISGFHEGLFDFLLDLYVLTAAHCITDSLIGVRFGEHDSSKNIDCNGCKPPIDVGIEKTIIHAKFSNISIINDIALIRLNTSVKFSPAVNPICLPVTKKDRLKSSFNKTFTVMGFGTTESGFKSNIMLKTNVSFIKNEECDKTYEKIERIKKISKGQICAGDEGINDSCKGDSGGPLISEIEIDKTGKVKIFQYGIVSFGVSCGTHPAVYTKVSHYINWISDNMEL